MEAQMDMSVQNMAKLKRNLEAQQEKEEKLKEAEEAKKKIEQEKLDQEKKEKILKGPSK